MNAVIKDVPVSMSYVIPPTTNTYTESDFGLEINLPDGTRDVYKAGDITFNYSEPTEESAGSLTALSITPEMEGIYGINLVLLSKTNDIGFTIIATTTMQSIVTTDTISDTTITI